MEDPYGFSGDKTWWSASTPMLVREVRRLKAVLQAALSFDIIHYNFGTTIAQPPNYERKDSGAAQNLASAILVQYRVALQHVELWLMRRLGRKIFVHYQGDDARQGAYQRDYSISLLNVNESAYSDRLDRQRRRQIALIGRYAERTYAVNPDLLNVLHTPARFLPYSHLDPRVVELSVPDVDAARTVIIGHAPTHRGVKGTSYVIAAVEALRHSGVDVELRLIEGLAHSEAMAAYRDIDILVDQLFAGWYGGLAVELMAMGKPVLAYIRGIDLVWVPNAMASEIPVISVTPESLESTLLDLVTSRRDSLRMIGLSGRRYAEDWHDPKQIAREVAKDYELALRPVQKHGCFSFRHWKPCGRA